MQDPLYIGHTTMRVRYSQHLLPVTAAVLHVVYTGSTTTVVPVRIRHHLQLTATEPTCSMEAFMGTLMCPACNQVLRVLLRCACAWALVQGYKTYTLMNEG